MYSLFIDLQRFPDKAVILKSFPVFTHRFAYYKKLNKEELYKKNHCHLDTQQLMIMHHIGTKIFF